MGDIADYYMDIGMDADANYAASIREANEYAKTIKERYLAGVLKWTTQAETKVKVDEMETNHLMNSRNMLQRGLRKDTDDSKRIVFEQWIEIFNWELEKR
tara:strand:- start:1979 stop:2278 length:300 start_codon:yes stop_codon:yes gene_type:complete